MLLQHAGCSIGHVLFRDTAGIHGLYHTVSPPPWGLGNLKAAKMLHYSPRALAMVWPISAGLWATAMPAAFRAAILVSADPSPPEIMAPACPMRRPGGAVRPAMKAATGFFTCLLT